MTVETFSENLPPRTSQPKFKHVILTRFNVRYVDDAKAPSIGTDLGWLADRFDLFERHCLPSILAQTQKDFSWILYFDRATPKPFVERVAALAAKHREIFPIFCETLPLLLVKKTIQEVVLEQPEWLLTTRFDNDDALHAEFVATVQSAQRFDRPEVLNCPNGLILRDDRLYRFRDYSNAFISLSEPFADFQSVFSISRHIYAHESYPVRQVVAPPRWLQVVHDNNISNKIRGWRIPRAQVDSGFLSLAETPHVPKRETMRSICFENLSMYFVRSFRDFATKNARRIAKLFGFELSRKPVPRRS